MDDYRQPIIPQEDGVINLAKGQHCGVLSNSTFRVDHLLDAIKRHLANKGQWLDEGFECELLSPGGIWQRGKIKLQLEFYPDQSDILLDTQYESEPSQNS